MEGAGDQQVRTGGHMPGGDQSRTPNSPRGHAMQGHGGSGPYAQGGLGHTHGAFPATGLVTRDGPGHYMNNNPYEAREEGAPRLTRQRLEALPIPRTPHVSGFRVPPRQEVTGR